MNRSIATLVATFVLAAPGVALADSPYHDDVYKERFFFAANHDAQPQSASMNDKQTSAGQGQKALRQGKTRQQVREELRNMTAEEKRRMQELYAN